MISKEALSDLTTTSNLPSFIARSQFFIAADTSATTYNTSECNRLWNGAFDGKYALPAARHNGMGNFIFGDGHIETHNPAALKSKRNMLTNNKVQTFYNYYVGTQKM